MPSFFVPLTSDADHAEVVYRELSTRDRSKRLVSPSARLFRVAFQYDDRSRRSGRRLQACVAQVGGALTIGGFTVDPVLGIFETTEGVEIDGLSDNKMSLQTLRLSPLLLSEKIYFDDFPEEPMIDTQRRLS